MGLLQDIFGEYTGDPGFIPEDGSTEIKIEQKAGEPDKRTVTRKPQPDLPAMGQAFNPMDLWTKVSKVVDAEMMNKAESDQKAQRLAQASNIGNDAVEQTNSPPLQTPGMFDTQMQGIPPNAAPEPPPVQGAMSGGWNDQQVDTGVPTTPPMPPDGPLPHIMDNVPPQGQRPGQPLPDPTAGMPYPPSVFPTYSMPGNPHELGGRPPWNQGNPYQPMEYPRVPVPQGPPPGQPMADPTAGEEYIGGQYFGEGSQRPTFDDLQTQNRPEYTDTFTPQEISQRKEAGETPRGLEQTTAAIKVAASEGTQNNNVDGVDASTDPMMWRVWGDLAQDPTARKADYLKQMNMLILGGIMLDGMAAAMGVQSQAGKYIESQLKIMEQAMKFDDQQRIYNLGRSVYYNEDGTYNPPTSQADAFDRLMRSGATVAEAQAISGSHPKGTTPSAIKEYFKIEPEPDGSHKSIFIDSKTAPPEGYTGSLSNATGGKDPAAMRVEAQVAEWNAQADALEAKGDTAGANLIISSK